MCAVTSGPFHLFLAAQTTSAKKTSSSVRGARGRCSRRKPRFVETAASFPVIDHSQITLGGASRTSPHERVDTPHWMTEAGPAPGSVLTSRNGGWGRPASKKRFCPPSRGAPGTVLDLWPSLTSTAIDHDTGPTANPIVLEKSFQARRQGLKIDQRLGIAFIATRAASLMPVRTIPNSTRCWAT